MLIISFNNTINDQKAVGLMSNNLCFFYLDYSREKRIPFLFLDFVLQIKISLFRAKLELSKVKATLVVYGS